MPLVKDCDLFLHFPQRRQKCVLYHRQVCLVYRDFLPVDSSGSLHSGIRFHIPAQHGAESSKHLVLSGETGGQRIVKILLDHVGDFCKARAFQQTIDNFRIGFSCVQISRCLHLQAQFFNIKICPVGCVDFSQQEICGDFKHFRNAEHRLMALSVLPMRVASCAWVILCSFISSCIRCRIFPGR